MDLLRFLLKQLGFWELKKKSLNIPIVLCTFSFCYECIRIQVTVQWIHGPFPKPLRVTRKVPEPPLRLNSSRLLPTTASNQGKVEAPEQEFPNLLKMPLAGNVYFLLMGTGKTTGQIVYELLVVLY